jgi:hypothetical protein
MLAFPREVFKITEMKDNAIYKTASLNKFIWIGSDVTIEREAEIAKELDGDFLSVVSISNPRSKEWNRRKDEKFFQI